MSGNIVSLNILSTRIGNCLALNYFNGTTLFYFYRWLQIQLLQSFPMTFKAESFNLICLVINYVVNCVINAQAHILIQTITGKYTVHHSERDVNVRHLNCNNLILRKSALCQLRENYKQTFSLIILFYSFSSSGASHHMGKKLQ